MNGVALLLYRIMMRLLFTVVFFFVASTTAFHDNRALAESVAQQYYAEGINLLAKDNRAGGAAMMEKALAVDPNFVRAARHAAVTYYFLAFEKTGRTKEYVNKAQIYANKLLEIDHETADAHKILALLYGPDNITLAIHHLELFISAKTNRDESLLASDDAQLGSACGLLAILYGIQHDYDNCLANLKKFISMSGGDPLYAERVNRAKTMLLKLDDYFKFKKFQEPPSRSPAAQANRSAPTREQPVQNTRAKQSQSQSHATPISSPSAKVNTYTKEFQKAKDALDKEIQERFRQIQILTG